MRLWEIVLALIVLIQFLWLWLPLAENKILKQVTYIFAVAGIIAIAAHLVLEGYRWQMIPLYAIFALQTFWLEVRKLNSAGTLSRGGVLGRGLFVLLILVGVALPLTFPIPEMPTNPGEFAIGSINYHIIDEARDEPHTLDPDDVRELMIQVWYPAIDNPNVEPIEFLPETALSITALSESLELPRFILTHLELLKGSAKPDLDPVPSDDGYPVIIFSHGYQSTRAQSTSLMESLASVGYVVAAIDHPYGGAITVYPDGRVALFTDPIDGEGEVFRRSALAEGEIWEADIASTLATLEAMQAGDIESPLEGILDLDTVGMMGHSTGAGVVSQFCSNDEETCDAVIGMDIWMGPVADEVFAAGTDVPAFFFMSETWPKRENVERIIEYMDNSANAQWLLIEGTGHYDFADIPYLSPLTTQIGLSGEIDTDRGHRVIEAYVLSFFLLHLRGEPTSLFNGPQSDYPEIDYTEPVAERFPNG